MLPNIARFALDKELASAFIIITYESREQRQKEYPGDRRKRCMWLEMTDADAGNGIREGKFS